MGWYILVGEVSIPLFDSVLLSILWWFVLKLNQKDTQKQLPSRLLQKNNFQKKLDLPWAQPSFWGDSEHHQPTVSRSWLIKHPPTPCTTPQEIAGLIIRAFENHWFPFIRSATVEGRNPAPVDMVNSPLFTGFCTSQVVGLGSSEPSTVWNPHFISRGTSRFSWPRGGVGGRLISHAINPWWDSGTATPECFGNMASSSRNLTT